MENFEKLDKEWMQKTEAMREKKISPAILSGFSMSVEREIRQRDAQRQTVRVPERSFRSVWAGAPVFAVLLIGVAVVLRLPSTIEKPSQALLAQAPAATMPNTADQISEDIAVLRELGVWTDEDDKNVGASQESSLEELELTDASVQKTSHLA
jgi:5-formaminoimidazole-4-carboxamide-1-beta-D-ribofuranosyl 5'-monophosphate synthetase